MFSGGCPICYESPYVCDCYYGKIQKGEIKCDHRRSFIAEYHGNVVFNSSRVWECPDCNTRKTVEEYIDGEWVKV